ncbi:MAG TPA: ATP-dependent 6-phosphofructokinase [Ktedonobacterales bacterium]|jgi:6-phosphofructokinase 1|nr:ATP-dependent 6-phosphofructokinase [Ktedonobacterales bacterium]
MRKLRRVAVLTSGGDAPGMNAAVRAVVRNAAARGIETYGVSDGYAGLIAGRLRRLDDRSVGGILHRGGTILGTARCREFCTSETQQRAIAELERRQIGALVVIGGNGSQQGAAAVDAQGFPVVGVASTIDNDLPETEVTIGFDSALNTATTYIDRLKDTATSHHRAFIVEVMGRKSGYLALLSAIATGAELAVVPEREVTLEAIAEDVQAAYARGKAHYIIVLAEGARTTATELAEYLCQHPSGFEARITVLGHVQRGGSPTARDRLYASLFGAAAIEALARGQHGIFIGWRKGAIAELSLGTLNETATKVTPDLLTLADVLAR